MFAEKRVTPRKYFKMKFWRRESGAMWLPFEREKIIEFAKVKPNERVSINGYVKWITNSVFALVPTLFSNQTYLLCVNNTNERPVENSYITVSGQAKFDRLRPRPDHPNSTTYEGTLLVQVHDWIYSNPNFKIPKSNLSYDEFKTDLTSRIEGLEPQIRDFLAFTAVSSPMFYENIGGLNLTMYDSTKSGLPRLVIRELKKVIPEDIGSLHMVETDFGRFGMRYKYAFVSEDADQPLSRQAEDLLAHNTSGFMPECTETSLSMFSARNKPVTIEDPPCSLSDVPTVIPEETSIIRAKRSIDQFDALNFIISNQMKTPVITELEPSLIEIAGKLERLTDDWDLDSKHLTQYGFLNASYKARPTSVLRESLAYARAQNINAVNPELVTKVFNDYFKWNFEYVYEIWEDLLSTPLASEKTMASLKVKYRDIIRIIRRYHSTNAPGAKKEDIVTEAVTSPYETEKLLNDCLRDGIIYEPVPGVYRLTRELA